MRRRHCWSCWSCLALGRHDLQLRAGWDFQMVETYLCKARSSRSLLMDGIFEEVCRLERTWLRDGLIYGYVGDRRFVIRHGSIRTDSPLTPGIAFSGCPCGCQLLRKSKCERRRWDCTRQYTHGIAMDSIVATIHTNEGKEMIAHHFLPYQYFLGPHATVGPY